MLRTIWVLTAGAVLTAVFASWVVVTSWFRKRRLPCLCEWLPRYWAGLVLRMSGVQVRLIGLEEVDWEAPLVVVANHQSWFDVFALTAHLPGKGRFVAKEELGRIPIFGAAWQACGHVSVDRSDRAQAIASLKAAGKRVRDEHITLILFPEGTRSPDGELQPFKKGAFVLAVETGVPVVPVGISGSREVMPKGSFRIRPGEITLRVGSPLKEEGERNEARNRLMEASRSAIEELIRGEQGLADETDAPDSEDRKERVP
jgi:1-acyl-sn-glycerol-3-phosphate acyltransferase